MVQILGSGLSRATRCRLRREGSPRLQGSGRPDCVRLSSTRSLRGVRGSVNLLTFTVSTAGIRHLDHPLRARILIAAATGYPRWATEPFPVSRPTTSSSGFMDEGGHVYAADSPRLRSTACASDMMKRQADQSLDVLDFHDPAYRDEGAVLSTGPSEATAEGVSDSLGSWPALRSPSSGSTQPSSRTLPLYQRYVLRGRGLADELSVSPAPSLLLLRLTPSPGAEHLRAVGGQTDAAAAELVAELRSPGERENRGCRPVAQRLEPLARIGSEGSTKIK